MIIEIFMKDLNSRDLYCILRGSAYSHVEHCAFFCVDDPFVDRVLLGVVDHFAANESMNNTNC